jgi:hypothetical protein
MANRRSARQKARSGSNRASKQGSALSGTSPSAARVPVTLRIASAVVVLEALATAGVGIWLLVEALIQLPRGLAIALSTGAFLLAAGAGLGVVAWGLSQARHWSRGLAAVSQLLLLPLGYELLSGSTWAAGVAAMVAALATVGLLFAPRSTAAFK